ncbi:uncharacterized protein LAESUDRAFT_127703 [Laetiporus sulphureus 93-53]|uniref:Uncharacterized protein n=1 Tax=Laetiporus sulphureus 93-53 TaxID=1314785 RepID=A0A165EGG6_9APHY|nr:uncharacterized protein LAESUDRAFT_127703 [Laetiporus sulphureus 93-53]KZT07006.1 hypothetical protein LAESUDRAFT_127703 [Laetiporus sulphureus 93-53]
MQNNILVIKTLMLLEQNCPTLEHFELRLVLDQTVPASRGVYTLAGLFLFGSFSPDNGPKPIGLTSLDGLRWNLIDLALERLAGRCPKFDVTFALRAVNIDVFYGDMAADAALAIEHAITSHLRSSYGHKARSSYALDPTEHSFEVLMDVVFLRKGR